MKNGLLTVLCVMMLAAPAAVLPAASAVAEPAGTLSPTRAEKAALAELLAARIKAALQGEEYRLDKSCDSEDDCTISIRP